MNAGRKPEVPPAEQLEGLRKARDHYSELADNIRDGSSDSSETSEQRRAGESAARRIAAAYENSFNNLKAVINRRGRK